MTNFPLLSLSFLGLGLLASCNNSDSSTIHTERTTTLDTLVSDGAWCWFSDPRAIYHEGQTRQMYFGYINQKGDVCVGSYNLETQQANHLVLHDTLEIDDHNVPTFQILPDGRLLIFYNEHNGNVFMRKSTNVEDISDWQPTKIIGAESEQFNYTYTNPAMLSTENNRLYLFGRKIGPTRSFDHWWPYFRFSDDLGETWSEDVILLDNEGRKNPPYMKVIGDHTARIDILFTDGHPKIGDDVSVYHMYYQDGMFYQTDGTAIASVEALPIPIRKVNKVYDATSSKIRAWIWDLARASSGHPVVTYARYPSENDHRYHYAYWDGKQWIDQFVCKAGGWMPSLRQGDLVREAHYSGGIVIDPNDTRSVYFSRQIEGFFEIEQARYTEDGWESHFITKNSVTNNMRPYVLPGSLRNQAIVLWMQGWYNHYTRYETSIVMHQGEMSR